MWKVRDAYLSVKTDSEKERGGGSKQERASRAWEKKGWGGRGKWLENDKMNRDHMTGSGRDEKNGQRLRQLMKCVKSDPCGFDGLVTTGALPPETTKTVMRLSSSSTGHQDSSHVQCLQANTTHQLPLLKSALKLFLFLLVRFSRKGPGGFSMPVGIGVEI